jgi:membrane-bound serine protease (ClpP class)
MRQRRDGWAGRIGIVALGCGVLGMSGALGGGFLARADQPASQKAVVEKLILNDTIQPVSAGELKRAIDQANTDGAEVLIVELNTPGGLLDSTRQMVGAMLSSRVPVVVYVAPSGARAGSAGFFLMEAADVAAMAPGTNAGAAHPVMELGGQPDAVMSQKIENDTEAFLRSFTAKRGRNAEAAEAAVHSSHSYTAEEALDQHLIDLIEPNEGQLLAALDGRTVTRMDGAKTTLHTSGARVVEVQPTLREELLGWLVDPDIAILLGIGGALLIYLEFNTPGTVVPGALGTLLVLLAVFGLGLLPIRFTAVLLLVAALGLMVLEAKFGGHGALAIAGIVCLAFGMLTLVAAPVPELEISPAVAIGVSLAFGAITVMLVRLAFKARRMKARLGVDALVGARATAMEELSPEGHVLVEGEIWLATSVERMEKGAPLRVTGHEAYLLRVERV